MKGALAAMASGRKLREVPMTYGIRVSTLKDRYKSGQSQVARLGRRITLTKEQEEDLADHTVVMANMFHGITPVELRRIAF